MCPCSKTIKRQPMVITQSGEGKAVIQDVVSYEETQQTLALLGTNMSHAVGYSQSPMSPTEFVL